LLTAISACLLTLSACSKSSDPNTTARPSAPGSNPAATALVDLSWRTAVGDEFWLTSESNVTDVPHTSGVPDPGRKAQRSRIIRRFRIRVLGVSEAKHPTSLQFFVETHTHDDLIAETGASATGPWTPLPKSGPAKWPPEQSTFTVDWIEKDGRWAPQTEADRTLFARATQDISAMLESRFLREEIPESSVRPGGTWSVNDSGRLALAKSMLGEKTTYSIHLTLDEATTTIDDTPFHVIRSKRVLAGKVPGGEGQPDHAIELATTSEVSISTGDVFRIATRTTGESVIPDIGNPDSGRTIHRSIDTSERIEPLRR